ncbi:MAG: type IV pilus assembly protein PilM [Patescibacteria group bacterium]|jgi:type IV pilus assembly protein PilM
MSLSFTLYTPEPPAAFGLDLSDDSLKIAQLSKARKMTVVDILHKESLPAGAIVDGEIKNADAVASVLKRVYDENRRILVPSVVLSLPETQTFTATIRVAKKDNKTLSELLTDALAEYLPDSIDKLYYNTQTIGEDNESWDVLVGAAPQALVLPYLDVVEKAGLTTLVLDIEALATANALISNKSDAEKTRAIINLGSRRASLILYTKGSVRFTLSLPISGEAVTKELQEQLAITREQAEQTKRLCGLDGKKCDGVLRQVLERMVQNLLDRIDEGRKYYRDHHPGSSEIEEIILSGGGAHLIGLDTILTEALSIPVRLGNIWENTSIVRPPEVESPLSFATVIGLAERALIEEKNL